MLNQQEAKLRVLAFLNQGCYASQDSIIILDEVTIKRPYGWIFFYQSQKFLETGNFSEMLVGNGPIVIEKANGTIHSLGSGYYKLEDEIREFEIRRFGTSDYRVRDKTDHGATDEART